MCVSVKFISIFTCCEIWIYVSTGQKYCGQITINKHSNICRPLSEGGHLLGPILLMGGQIRLKYYSDSIKDSHRKPNCRKLKNSALLYLIHSR